MRISQRSIDEVREAADIVEVASEFTALQRRGKRFSGLCPYPDHSERTPSFSVSPDRAFYYCFGCQRGGDAIKLVSELKSFSFIEAVSYIAERSGIELEYEGFSAVESRAAKERASRRRATHKALAAAAVYYHKYLLKSAAARHAREYLSRRQIDVSTIEEFRLGYAPPRGSSAFLRVARSLNLNREVLDNAGLLSSRGGERFFGRITFPICDRRGRIVGFGARALGDNQPKYLNSPETQIFNKRDLLYGFPQVSEALRRERAALVVEGYTDVLMLYQSGIKNTVATLGTATTPAHLRTLSGYADRIYLLFDPDAAGEKAIERAASTAAELRLDLRVVRLPEDPADWLLEHPPQEFFGLMSGSVPALEYVFRRKAERARGAPAAERSRMMAEVRELLKSIEDPVFLRDAVRVASEALGVRPEVLQNVLRESPLRHAPEVRSGARPVSEDPHRQAGEEVLALVLARPDLTERLLRDGMSISSRPEPLRLTAEDFGDDEQARIFTVLNRHATKNVRGVFSDEQARPLMDRIGALLSRGERLYSSAATVSEAWLRLGILSRERSKRETPDYDLKEEIHREILSLREALRTVSLES